jgi:hypothetical protein
VVTSRASRPSIFVSSSRFELPILAGALGAANVPADPDRDNGDPSSDADIAAFAVAIDGGVVPYHGTSRDAFLTFPLVNYTRYTDENWRERHAIADPRKYKL